MMMFSGMCLSMIDPASRILSTAECAQYREPITASAPHTLKVEAACSLLRKKGWIRIKYFAVSTGCVRGRRQVAPLIGFSCRQG
jgi:hypothetical protein